MRKEEFFETLGKLDDDILEKAKITVKRKISTKAVRITLIAAILTAALAIPAAAYTIETVRYNAAVDYLKALGVDVIDLSDYSRNEVIHAVNEYKTYEAGNPAADNIIASLLPDNAYTGNPSEPAYITSDQVRKLTPTMTLSDVIKELGETMDIGSGIYILIYKVDDIYTLTIPFAGYDAQLGVSGDDLLKALQPIEENQELMQ